MKPSEAVDLIQFYRHELLNHLQIIQGYMKMGNLDKADKAMNKLFESLHMERHILSLNIPNVFLWIFKSQMKYQHFKITYSVEIENKNISSLDGYITESLEQTMQEIIRNYNEEKVYRVHLAFKEEQENGRLEISVDNEIITQIELFTS